MLLFLSLAAALISAMFVTLVFSTISAIRDENKELKKLSRKLRRDPHYIT